MFWLELIKNSKLINYNGKIVLKLFLLRKTPWTTTERLDLLENGKQGLIIICIYVI